MEDHSCRRAIAAIVVLFSFVHNATSLSVSVTNKSEYAPHLKTKIASSVAKTERREKERSFTSRPTCSVCSRPPMLCVCPALPKEPIYTSTHVLILQHPREFRRKNLSTTPLMPLVLENCSIKRGYNFEPEELDLVTQCTSNGQKPLILFPGDDAVSLDDIEDEQNNPAKSLGQDNHLLILIDGTWSEAKRMISQSPRLMDCCQQIQFTSEYESIYSTVRKEPEKHCISTLEASAYALPLLEKDGAKEASSYLLGSMQYMIDKKLSVFSADEAEPRFTRPGSKIREKNKRRFEIKKQLFNNINN